MAFDPRPAPPDTRSTWQSPSWRNILVKIPASGARQARSWWAQSSWWPASRRRWPRMACDRRLATPDTCPIWRPSVLALICQGPSVGCATGTLLVGAVELVASIQEAVAAHGR